MPPQPPPPAKPNKFYFFYGKRRPSQNRPAVYGGLFSNRQTLDPHALNPKNPRKTLTSENPTNFSLQNWDTDAQCGATPPPAKTPSENFFQIAQRLSPIARYVCDSFRKHGRWGPQVIEDLGKLRRVRPDC